MDEKTSVTMYYYFDSKGNQLWTSNELMALNRAKEFDSEVYKVELNAKQITTNEQR